MAAADLEHLDRFITTLPDRPRSFAERGATVLFTTPALAAARLRRVGTAHAELLLPAPGGRGTCVLDWDGCLGLSPTLHDRDLWKRLDALPLITPAGLRAAARATAATGLAGRAAQAAARAPKDDADARLDGLTRLAETANEAAFDARLPAEREAARLVACAARLSLSAARNATLAERVDWLLDGWDLPVALLAGGGKGALSLGDVLASLAAPALEAERWWPSAGGWDAVLLGRARLAPRPGWALVPRTSMAPRLEAARAAAP